MIFPTDLFLIIVGIGVLIWGTDRIVNIFRL